MRNLIYLLLSLLVVYSCATTGTNNKMDGTGKPVDSVAVSTNDTVRIANDSLEYEIIITDPGFRTFLLSTARPEGYYSQSYLETKNNFLVIDYNQRVMQPFRFNPNLYPQQIDYDPKVDYGYEVNYKLYYYFVFFSREYNQRFSVPTRI